MTDYLTFLTTTVDTTGSVADARGALGFLASMNDGGGWDKDAMLGGRAALPLEAMKRRHAHAVEKAPGLPARLVLDVLRRYAYLEAGVETDRQWHLAIGVAIGCAFKLMARYADMRHVRYDDEGFRVHDMYIRIFVSERKTHVSGVKSMDWLVGYMRADLMDRLRASWSLGL